MWAKNGGLYSNEYGNTNKDNTHSALVLKMPIHVQINIGNIPNHYEHAYFWPNEQFYQGIFPL